MSECVPSPRPDEISRFRTVVFVFLVWLCQIMTQAQLGQTVNPSPDIAKTFNVENNLGEISWFTASYSLTVGTFILMAGRLGDMYGYKLIFILGFLVAGIFSLVTGFSGFTSSAVFYDAMRGLQGIGPAMSLPNAVALVGHYFPPGKPKQIYMAGFGAVAPLGFFLGALFSGIFAQLVWWPWMFWVGGIVNIVVAGISFVVIPKNIGSKNDTTFDWWGSITGMVGLILINFAWNQGPNVGWTKVYVYVLLIVGFLFMGLFYIVSKHVKDPLVPFQYLQGETGFVLVCVAAGWSCFGIWLYYGFEWQRFVYGTNDIMNAVQLVPSPLSGCVAAFLTVILLRVTTLLVVMFFLMVAFFVGSVLMGTRHVGQTYWGQKFVSLLIQAFGMDMSFPAATMIISGSLPKNHQGLAGLLVSTFVNYSISIGLGFAGTVEYYTTKNEEKTRNVRIKGMRNAFYMGMGLAGLGVVIGAMFVILQYFHDKNEKKFTLQEKEGSSESQV